MTATAAPTLPPFRNEPILELRREPHRRRLLEGLERLRLPIEVPVWVGADTRTGDDLVSTDPGNPEHVVATAATATPQETEEAVARAHAAFRPWSETPVEERARLLVKAADIMRGRRAELTALAVRECAKPWAEADADVCEAIDFLEYYARQAIEIQHEGPPLLEPPGERNELRYHPRGVCAVIAPWNFPIAIPLGMTAAALATGNTAVLKPAEQAPGCGYELTRALKEAGLPPDVLHLLPGEGDVGAQLVEDPRVATIAFTGSGAVGLKIIESAARTKPGQKQLKRVVAEMGGKNCVVVDADADLDDAVPALVDSAFIYAGQKCSAADRVLVHQAIADQLVERVAGAVKTLQVGQADTFGTDVPPVIEQEAQERVNRYIEQCGDKVVGRQAAIPGTGWFVTPTAAAHLDPDAPVLREEVFGPLLTIEAVKDVDDALDRIDQLSYALTSGLFCRNPRTVDHVARRNPVGNLYVNRRITGAMVGRQPFGGNRLSGTGTKAGGPDYLLHFVEPRVVTENTVRHGLVVE
ncbi:MAG: aldehyde dehydrogenase family protein [Actinomycetota bacterium]|nr:aldehyde dehydrogenase family protein [Actinomycetota bacterium]